MRRGTTILAVMALACVAVAAGHRPETLLLAPSPLELVGGAATLPPGCAFTARPDGAVVRCPEGTAVELVVSRPGYEPRAVRFEAGDASVDLGDERWRPAPVPLRLGPEETAGRAVAVWLEEGELRSALPSRGRVEGPRLPPGEPFALAVVGPEIAPAVVRGTRDPGREPVAVWLEPGRSAAAVCRDPWTFDPLPGCRVEVGTVTGLLDGLGGGHLIPRGRVADLGELAVLDLGDGGSEAAGLWVRASSPEGGTTLEEVVEGRAVYELVLEPPRALRVSVVERGSGRAVAGAEVVVSREVGDGRLVVAEALAAGDGGAELALPPAVYRVTAEAAGHGSASLEVELEEDDREVTLSLPAAATVAGVVQTAAGEPLAGATVAAVGPGFGFESRHNFALTGADGRFEVTLTGEGPWTLLARLEGYEGDPVTVERGTDWVTMVLRRRCEVTLWALAEDGAPLAVSRLVLLRPGVPEVVIAEPGAEPGTYRATLAPGPWAAVAEEVGRTGTVEVPEPCTGLTLPLALAPVGNTGGRKAATGSRAWSR